MTTVLTGNRSPERGREPRSRAQRGSAYPSLPSPTGEGSGVTLSDLTEGARRRAAKRRTAVAILRASGAHKAAFNEAMHALQGALAREHARRPAEAAGLYECLGDLLLEWAASAPALVAEDLAQPGPGGQR